MVIHSRPIRPSRVRRRARLIAILLSAVPLGLGVSGAYANLGPVPGGETVTFVGSGARPSCTSTPDQGRVSIVVGDWLNLVNHTGGDATLDTGKRRLAVRDGHAAAVKLAIGAHAVRLIPDCATTPADAVAVAVEVLRPVSRPEGTGPPAGGHDPPEDRTTDRLSAISEAAPPTGRANSEGGSAAAAGGGHPGGPASAFEETRLLSPPPPDDSGHGGLLAVMAAVCVFGVTAAIIRAIVTQRSSNTIGR